MGRKHAQDSPGTLHTIVGGVKCLRVGLVVVVVVVVGGGGGGLRSLTVKLKKILHKDATYLCGWVSDMLLKNNSPISGTVFAQE